MKTTLPKKKKISKALLSHSKHMEDWVKPIKGKKYFSHHAANSFVIGVLFDRGVIAERAWIAAEWMNNSIGDKADGSAVWNNLKKMEAKRLRGFLRYGYGGFAFHRHYKTFAQQLPIVASIIIEKYTNDPRKIWNSTKDVNLVKKRLEELPGIGPALSNMAVLILVRNYGLIGGMKSLANIDIKPDIHVMRVFKRSGLISNMNNISEAIEIARTLCPDYPGSLDAPAFEIGREYCFKTNPSCPECAIKEVCKKII